MRLSIINVFVTLLLVLYPTPSECSRSAIASQLVRLISTILTATEERAVIVENNGRHHAHLWCASRDDRIGDHNGIWLAPGTSLGWSFRAHGSTQFWCTLDWFGRRTGWDVFHSNWGGKMNRWHIRDDGIYDQRGYLTRHLESNIVVG
jgi:hypothetical protein